MYFDTPYRTQLVTPPAAELMSLDEAKLHLKVDFTDDDDLISAWIVAARQRCETAARRSFVTQTWDLLLDAFPGFDPGGASLWYVLRNLQRGYYPVTGREAAIDVPRPPLVSVTSVEYLDADGASQTLSPTSYRVSLGTPGRITPAYGASWPTALCVTDAVTVRFVAGYGDATAVPETDKAAVKLMLSHLYYHRGDEDVPPPRAILDLLSAEDWGSYG